MRHKKRRMTKIIKRLKKMGKRKKISLAITAFVVFLGVGILVYSLEKGIPIRAIEETISNFALVTYKDESGKAYGPISSNTVATTKQPTVQYPTIKFNLKLQGRSNYQTSSLKMKIYQAGTNIIYREYSNVSNNATGTDTDKTFDDITTEYTADIWVKLDGFLAKKVKNVKLSPGQIKEIDFGELLVGDFTGDNKINIFDISLWLEQYKKEITPDNAIYDVNQDNQINVLDLGFILDNYKKEGD